MSSTASQYIANINPNYPVPGVDNNTQGFRDNFNNIQVALDTINTYVQTLADVTIDVNAPNVTGTYVTAESSLSIGGTNLITTNTDYALLVSADGMSGKVAVFPSIISAGVTANVTGEELEINGSIRNIQVGAQFTLTGSLSTITFNVVQVDLDNSIVYADQSVAQGNYQGYFTNPSFPTEYTAVNPTQVAGAIESVLPYGMIMLWYGTISNIPSGWSLCDGTNGTPDLTNVFVIGANADYNGAATSSVTSTPLTTGGSAASALPSHTHDVYDQGHTHSLNAAGAVATSGGSGVNYSNGTVQAMASGAGGFASGLGNANVSIINTGTDATYGNLPPFYALAYIMKVV